MRIKTLLVDDDMRFLSIMNERLELAGIDVETAVSAEHALMMMETTAFDVIVLDYQMPGMNGIQSLKAIKARSPDVQVILLSGYATIANSVAAMKNGAADFMEKPADFNRLIDVIRHVAREHASGR